jgi:peptide-methionine (R)-S-oxide reductase
MKDETKEKSDKDWSKSLTKEQYHILREAGTERPFTGIYWNHFKEGKYHCAGCGTELFDSKSKFESNCGWPSFAEPSVQEKIETKSDTKLGMDRTEVLCKECGGHLGHVFNDGPKEMGGLRYCINSVALGFTSDIDSKND